MAGDGCSVNEAPPLHAGSTNISHYPLDYLVDYASPTTGAVGHNSRPQLFHRSCLLWKLQHNTSIELRMLANCWTVI